MDLQAIKLIEMMYYKKKKIELKLKFVVIKSDSTLTAILGAILNNWKYKLIDQ